MIRYCTVGILLIILSACVATNNIAIKPAMGIEFDFSKESIDLIEMVDNEVLLYRSQKLVGSIQRVSVPDSSKTAVESLKEGLKEAQKGSNKPSILSLSANSYGFVVHTIDFSTVFIATTKDTDHWVVISVKQNKYNELIKALKL